MALRERQQTRTQEQSNGRRTRPPRSTFAFALALTGLVFALVGALGPAEHLRTRYAWPPDLAGAKPERLWYTPLLLTRQEPESISATIPCFARPLAGATEPTILLATAREPANAGALAVTRNGDRLNVRVGDRTLASVTLPLAASGSCVYRLELDGRAWSLNGPGGSSQGGSLESMPAVVGLFSGVDLQAGTAPSIELTTTVYGTETRLHQTIFWTLAAFAGIVALLLVGVRRVPRRPSAGMARRALGQVGLPDAAVAVLLLVWWVLGPAFYDDGWVAARQGNYSASGGFSAYYSSFGVNLPLDYWLEWLEHWLVESSSALLVFRIPALVCLAAIWILCRWLLARITTNGAARWTLACAFAVGALAWGMTFRPEPVVALLVTGVFACTVRFVERRTVAPLVLAAALVALALSAHPAGIVAIAPLLAAAPALLDWGRAHARISATVLAAAGALLLALVTVGSDLQQRRADIASLRAYGDETAGWRDELTRYSFLSQSPYGSPLRREFVVVTVLAVLAYVLRRRREPSDPLLGLPALSLGLSLVLLIATPTKWPWHFGVLIGLAAVAVTAEIVRLRAEAKASRGWELRPFLVLAVAVLAAAWSWNPRLSWGDLDLRTLGWTLGLEERVTLSKLAGALPLLLLAALTLRMGTKRLREVPWRAAVWTVPVLTVPLIAFTVAVLAVDTARTSSWTLARQNLETLTGGLGCGLADEAVVPVPSSMRALPPLSPAGGPPLTDDSLPPSPVQGVPRLTLGPAPARSPWFRLRPGERVGFFATGAPAATTTLDVEWGRSTTLGVERVGSAGLSGAFTDDAHPELVAWHFYAAGDLPSAPPEANAFRLSLQSDFAPGAAIGVTAPVTYVTRRLAEVIDGDRSRTLALPNLLTYVPCVEQPRVGASAEVPDQIVGFRASLWPLAEGTSPFDGLPDLYRLVRLSLSDSPDPPGDLAVYDVDRHIDGAALATPVTTVIR